MAQHFYLAGVELDPDRVRLESDRPLAQAAELTVSGAGVQIEDPDGDLDFNGWKTFVVSEDSCTETRTWTGYIAGRRIQRGASDNVGAARIHECDLYDLNAIMGFRVLRAATAKRPYETEAQRIAWLLGSEALDGLVFDNGYVTTNAQGFDEADFRGQYALDVLSSVGSTAKQAYVFWDSAASAGEEVTLWYNTVGTADRFATIAISNVLADVDDVTTFEPEPNATLDRDPSETYSGCYMTWRGGALYDELPTTATDFVARDGRYDSSRIGRLATAQAALANWLASSSVEQQRISCTVRLPSSKVNLALPGQWIDARFSHLPGVETTTSVRIVSRIVRPTPRWDAYDVDFVLAAIPIGGGQGGGGSEDFPPGDGGCVPSETPLLGTVSAYYAVGANAAQELANVNDNDTTTFSSVANGVAGAGDYHSGWSVDLTTAKTLSSMRLYSDTDGADYWAHTGCADTGTAGRATHTTTGTYGRTYTYQIGYSDDGSTFTWFDYDWAIPGPGFDVFTAVLPDDLGAHRYWSFAWSWTMGGLGFYVGIDALSEWWVYECVAQSSPPAPNQPVNGETPTPAPDGAETDFATAYPFADRTLVVLVDGIDQTDEVTTYDGTTGDFTLSFAPLADEELRVWYRGR